MNSNVLLGQQKLHNAIDSFKLTWTEMSDWEGSHESDFSTFDQTSGHIKCGCQMKETKASWRKREMFNQE